MATADHIKALVKSHAVGDEERFYAVAIQVAANAARQGHAKFAKDLRDLVHKGKTRDKASESGPRVKPVSIVQPKGELSGLITASFPSTRLKDMALDEKVGGHLDRILLEQSQRQHIRAHGMEPMRKLLFVGPPGTGKTMTASALACELGLPLFRIQLDGLITRYLGETAAKLRLIFEEVQQTRAVYFFDEFDALGSERATRNEVGEMRRVLNSFLQFLEEDDSDSIVAGATNHPQLLDHALFRRFDSTIEYSLPSPEVKERGIRDRLAGFDTSEVNWPEVLDAGNQLSHAEIARACEHAAKYAILQGHVRIDSQELFNALQEWSARHR